MPCNAGYMGRAGSRRHVAPGSPGHRRAVWGKSPKLVAVRAQRSTRCLSSGLSLAFLLPSSSPLPFSLAVALHGCAVLVRWEDICREQFAACSGHQASAQGHEVPQSCAHPTEFGPYFSSHASPCVFTIGLLRWVGGHSGAVALDQPILHRLCRHIPRLRRYVRHLDDMAINVIWFVWRLA